MIPERIRIGHCNSYLVRGSRGFMLVDTANDHRARAILRAISRKRLRIEDLELIVLTHVHFDHVLGTAVLQEKSRCQVICPACEASMLEEGITPTPAGTMAWSRAVSWIGRHMYPGFMRFTPAHADILVSGETDLNELGYPYRVIPTPGHTAGGISLVMEGDHAIVGDALYGPFGMIYPPFANDTAQLDRTWEKLLSMDIPLFYTGHGAVLPRVLVEKEYRKRRRTLS